MCAFGAMAAQAQSNEGGHSERAVSAAPQAAGEETQSETAHGAMDHAATPGEAEAPTALIANHGNGGFPVATSVPEAQAFFDNGIELAFAFAHEDAIRAMAEAVRRDPNCAMCLAGHAFTLGPTVNYPKSMEEREAAHAVAEQALAMAGDSDFERGFAEAMIERYRPQGTTDDRDTAYAQAMARLAARFPEHDTLQVLAADAQMISDFETASMRRAMDLLEPVLARSPDHSGAIHFYIHATEIYGEPALAEAAADRLAAMNLDASHLVHMPSHTYYWVGRYGDAADANRMAVQIGEHQAMAMGDEDPMAVWGIPYHVHNVIFGLGGAMMADDSRTALMLARPMIERAQSRDEGSYFAQLLMSAAYFAMGRFESPNVVLALEEPRLPYLQAAWHYARGEAYAFLGDGEGLAAERDAIPENIAQSEAEEDDRLPAADQMLAITRAVLAGRLAMMEGRYDEAAAFFAEAAATEETEDFSQFSDPPAFWYPVRRDLAQALLAAGDETAALREAVATLEVRPRDPVAQAIIARLVR
ncbi:hypothetical protein H6P80_04025 [Parasphingopyxis sp. GrpM-11]|uniref:Tetratricopeptide repeat protein n=1 Tax=Parasphingopyxis marina TaxID=2761622 RepID=A0A842HXX2_9SPHN|nr:hypothetical protein [Parasphingopyxis marina]